MMGWIRESSWLMQVLREVRDIAGPGAVVAAGVLRSLAWSRLHGQSVQAWERSWRTGAAHQASPRHELPAGAPAEGLPSAGQPDIDVVFHDAHHQPGHDAVVARALARRMPDVRWEVVNQAWVHTWLRDGHGAAVPARASLADAIATWPETATAIAARLDESGELCLMAPLGLDDLMALRLRHHPAVTTRAQFLARVGGKGWLARWPRLQVVPEMAEVPELPGPAQPSNAG